MAFKLRWINCSICSSEQPCMVFTHFLLLFLSAFYNARLSVVNVTQMCLETLVMCNNCKPLYLLPALINHSSSQRNGCAYYRNSAHAWEGQTRRPQVPLLTHTGWHSLTSPHPHNFLSLINAMLT